LILKNARGLEGSTDSELCDLVIGQMLNGITLVFYDTFCGLEKSRDQIEQSGFTSAVWSDEAKNFSLTYAEADT